MSQTKAQLIDPVDGSSDSVNADINASAAIAWRMLRCCSLVSIAYRLLTG